MSCCCCLPSPLLSGMKGTDSTALKSADLYTDVALTPHKCIKSAFDSGEDGQLYPTAAFEVVYSSSACAINLNLQVCGVFPGKVCALQSSSALSGFNMRKVQCSSFLSCHQLAESVGFQLELAAIAAEFPLSSLSFAHHSPAEVFSWNENIKH